MKQFAYQSTNLEFNIYKSSSLWQQLHRRILRKPTTILYLHGLGDPYQNHADLFRYLNQAGLTVYAINFPGHGKSGDLAEISWEVFADITAKFAKEMRLKHVLLMGYSMGGGMALKLLEDKPQWVRSVVLVAPFCSPLKLADLQNARGYLSEFMRLKLPHPEFHKPPAASVDSKYLLQHYSPLFINYELNVDAVAQHPCAVTAFLNLDDRVILAEHAKPVLEAIPRIQIIEVPGLSHDLYYITDEEVYAYAQKIIKYGT